MATLYLLLFLAVFLDTFKNIYYNFFGKNLLETNKDTVFFNVIGSIGTVAFFALFLLFSNNSLSVSIYTFISALVFAVITTAAQYFCLLSMSLGSMSFSVLFTYLSALIPTIFGIVYRQASPTVLQISGLVLMIITFILSIDFEEKNSMSIKWLLAVFGSFLGMGLVGVCQTVHQTSVFAGEIYGFLFWAFVFSLILFTVIYIPYSLKHKKQGREKKVYSKKDYAAMIITGIFVGAINLICLYLSGKLPSIIFFPIVNGGVIILSGLASIFLFKEKLPAKKLIGLAVGIIAVCLIGI